METLLALSSPKKTSAFSKRIKRKVIRVRNGKDLLERLEADEPAVVFVDMAMPSVAGIRLLEEIKGKVRDDLFVLVNDLASFDPDKLSAALGSESKSTDAAALMPELHNPESGRIDAKKVAAFLGLSLTKFAKALGRSPQSVHKTPDSVRLQDELGLYLRLAAGLEALLGSQQQARIWLNTPHPDLDKTRPLDLVEKRKAEIVAELVEDTLLGHPG